MAAALSQAFDKSKFSPALVILTVGVEEFASFVVFECPCNRDYNRNYGLIFMLAPAVVLFCATLVKQKMFWQLITGSCRGNVSIGGRQETHVMGVQIVGLHDEKFYIQLAFLMCIGPFLV